VDYRARITIEPGKRSGKFVDDPQVALLALGRRRA
jgi:hypothetical protein